MANVEDRSHGRDARATVRRYVLLDRDGTLIVDRHYLRDPEGVELLPGVVQGLRLMRKMGLGLVVVSNQSGVGRGYFDLEAVRGVNARMESLLAVEGVTLEAIHVCPHRPDEGCECRKPRTGMVLAAAKELGFTPSECFVVGDRGCDVELGRNVGAVTILVEVGRDTSGPGDPLDDLRADYVVRGLVEAARIIQGLLDGQSC